MIIHGRRSGNSLANDAACWISFYNVSEKISISTRGPGYVITITDGESTSSTSSVFSVLFNKVNYLKKKKNHMHNIKY